MFEKQMTLVPAGWYHMDAAPRNCTHVDLLMRDGSVVEDAHWASDLSGEEQPAFEGWFVKASESSYRDAGDPIAWRPRATIGRGSEGNHADD
jgi:hypothetical protein